MNLVDVGLFGREVDVFANLVADIAQKLIVDKILDNSMLISGGR